MSANVLEKVLWDLSVDRDSKNRFREDPDEFLGRYHLTDAERRMVREFDVRGLADAGVSTMLTMGYWMQLESSHDMGRYLARMTAAALCPGAPRD